MKKSTTFLILTAILVFSSCTLSSLGGTGGSGLNGDDIFNVANQTVSGSLQTVCKGTNSGGFFVGWSTNVQLNFTAGWVKADLTLTNYLSNFIVPPYKDIHTNFVLMATGNVILHDFRTAGLVNPVNGTLLGTCSLLFDFLKGSNTRVFTFSGDLTNGGKILQVHFESYSSGWGTNQQTIFSNCTVNGQEWTPSL